VLWWLWLLGCVCVGVCGCVLLMFVVVGRLCLLVL